MYGNENRNSHLLLNVTVEMKGMVGDFRRRTWATLLNTSSLLRPGRSEEPGGGGGLQTVHLEKRLDCWECNTGFVVCCYLLMGQIEVLRAGDSKKRNKLIGE